MRVNDAFTIACPFHIQIPHQLVNQFQPWLGETLHVTLHSMINMLSELHFSVSQLIPSLALFDGFIPPSTHHLSYITSYTSRFCGLFYDTVNITIAKMVDQ
jgi:hypothetical protein